MKPKPIPAYPVSDPRHTLSGSHLSDLCWDNWFTDGGPRQLYLHVQHRNGETWHRVFCRHADRPRLESRKGKLYWLVDQPRTAKPGP